MNINPVSFGKTYISKTPVRNNKTGEKEQFDFVQYNTKEDIESVEKTSDEWKANSFGGGIYAGYIAEHMRGDIPENKFNKGYYGIEDSNGDIQAVCEVEYSDDNWALKGNRAEEIIYMETNPKNTYGTKQRKYSGLGISMFSKLVELAKKNYGDRIEIIDASDGFWESLPFIEKTLFRDILILKRKNYDDCIKKLNEMI